MYGKDVWGGVHPPSAKALGYQHLPQGIKECCCSCVWGGVIPVPPQGPQQLLQLRGVDPPKPHIIVL